MYKDTEKRKKKKGKRKIGTLKKEEGEKERRILSGGSNLTASDIFHRRCRRRLR